MEFYYYLAYNTPYTLHECIVRVRIILWDARRIVDEINSPRASNDGGR